MNDRQLIAIMHSNHISDDSRINTVNKVIQSDNIRNFEEIGERGGKKFLDHIVKPMKYKSAVNMYSHHDIIKSAIIHNPNLTADHAHAIIHNHIKADDVEHDRLVYHLLSEKNAHKVRISDLEHIRKTSTNFYNLNRVHRLLKTKRS